MFMVYAHVHEARGDTRVFFSVLTLHSDTWSLAKVGTDQF